MTGNLCRRRCRPPPCRAAAPGRPAAGRCALRGYVLRARAMLRPASPSLPRFRAPCSACRCRRRWPARGCSARHMQRVAPARGWLRAARQPRCSVGKWHGSSQCQPDFVAAHERWHGGEYEKEQESEHWRGAGQRVDESQVMGQTLPSSSASGVSGSRAVLNRSRPAQARQSLPRPPRAPGPVP